MIFVRVTYRWRGGKTAASVRGSVRAYTVRDGPDVATRQWYDRDGQARSAAEVQAAVAADGQAHRLTYRMLISTSTKTLDTADYTALVASVFGRAYWIEHRTTAHPYIFVIGFRDQLLARSDLIALRERGAALEHAIEPPAEDADVLPW